MVNTKNFFRNGMASILAYDQGFEHGPKDFDMTNVDPKHIVGIASSGNYTGLALCPGTAEKYYNKGNESVPLIVKLNSKTHYSHGDALSLANCSVQRAVKMNAQAVGYTLYTGSLHEQKQYQEFGRIIGEAHDVGLSVIAWAYPRGHMIDNELSTDTIAYAVRIAAELGADIIKCKYNLDAKGFPWVVSNALKAKVVVSGGSKTDQHKFLSQLKDTTGMGAKGTAVGRNVWQDPKPYSLSRAIGKLYFDNGSVDEALLLYNEGND
ncbi:MAG: class I fructose-bisphosphate aldolase [Candidatus Woesearchaeota archaeon]